jgi:hypothetical protein
MAHQLCCDQLEELLWDYASGRAEEPAMVEDHLQACTGCCRTVEQFHLGAEAVEALREAAVPDAPPDWADLNARLPLRPTERWQPRLAFITATCVVIACLVLARLLSPVAPEADPGNAQRTTQAPEVIGFPGPKTQAIALEPPLLANASKLVVKRQHPSRPRRTHSLALAQAQERAQESIRRQPRAKAAPSPQPGEWRQTSITEPKQSYVMAAVTVPTEESRCEYVIDRIETSPQTAAYVGPTPPSEIQGWRGL